MAILATHTDTEREPARRQLGERGDLPGDGQRMPERQEVDGGAHPDRARERRQGGRLDEPVEALTALERHVIPDAQLIDAGSLGALDDGAQVRRAALEQLAGWAEPDTNGARAHDR